MGLRVRLKRRHRSSIGDPQIEIEATRNALLSPVEALGKAAEVAEIITI
jgi:hypothetical protein